MSGANRKCLFTEPEDSELLRERMLDIESALAEAAEDDDGMDGF